MLEVNGLHVYYGGSHILKDVSLKVGEGECVALLGRNGAGKTTTLRSIFGYVPVRKGSVTFKGQTLNADLTHKRVQSGMAFVPEDRGIFPSVTVDHHLNMAFWAARRRRPHPPSRVYEMFPRLAQRAGSLGGQLSGGEQQMLSIGRALLSRPDVLVLDEPSEGLAPVIVQQLELVLLKEKAQGTPILLVEQNYRLARNIADRAYVLNQGQVVFAGTFDELEEDEDKKRRYLAL